MPALTEQQRIATLAVLGRALVHLRAEVSSASGPGRSGLPRETCGRFSRLLNLLHNIPAMAVDDYPLRFNEGWFLGALAKYDAESGTSLVSIYQRALAGVDE